VVRYAVRYADLSTTLRALADAIDACGPDGLGKGEGVDCGCC
jgi:hypothetical protein